MLCSVNSEANLRRLLPLKATYEDYLANWTPVEVGLNLIQEKTKLVNAETWTFESRWEKTWRSIFSQCRNIATSENCLCVQQRSLNAVIGFIVRWKWRTGFGGRGILGGGDGSKGGQSFFGCVQLDVIWKNRYITWCPMKIQIPHFVSQKEILTLQVVQNRKSQSKRSRSTTK